MKRGEWSCPDCGWFHRAHPAYPWDRVDDQAVEVHQTMLCPCRPGVRLSVSCLRHLGPGRADWGVECGGCGNSCGTGCWYDAMLWAWGHLLMGCGGD